MEVKDTFQQLQEQTAQYAIEHITGKGLHKGIGWLRDSFNQLCQAMGIPDLQEPDNYDRDELVEFLKKAPWVAEIAAKPADNRTHEDIDRVVYDFICENYLMRPEDVTTKDVADVLKVADTLSRRRLVAQKVAIDCIYALDNDELQQLDGVLADLEKNPELGKSKGFHR